MSPGTNLLLRDLPARFQRRPHLLANALSAVKTTTDVLDLLADFVLPRLPRRPLASSSIHTAQASSELQLLDNAVLAQSIAYNNADYTNAVTIDCDHADAHELVDAFMPHLLAQDPKAPRPMVVSDWWTGRAHVTWFLEEPVYTGPQADPDKSKRVLRTLDAVRSGLCAALKGDRGYTNRLTKNPFAAGLCPSRSGTPANSLLWDYYADVGSPLRFHTVTGDLEGIVLLTLWRALKAWREETGEVIPYTRKRVRPDPDESEKGVRLFDAARYAVYDLRTSDLSTIQAVVDEKAALLGSPAGEKQRRNIARSIARFMATKWTGRLNGAPQTVRRGVMRLESASLDLSERQALGGKFAGKTRALKTDEKIAQAVAGLQAAGSAITQATVAEAAGVSLRTVKSRWNAGRPNGANQCPSGNAGLPAPRPAGEGVLGSKKIFSFSLVEVARCQKRIRATLASLASSTALNGRLGSVPLPVPVVPADLTMDPAVRSAVRLAQTAFKGAKGRADQRAVRAEVQSRAAMFREWAIRPDGWGRFKQHVADLEMHYDDMASEATSREAPYLEVKREAVLRGRWRTWKAALNAALPAVRDEDIPW